MSEINEILKKVTASIEEATGKFNAKAEDALKEAQKSGRLSEETKAAVDKMASEFNALREAEKTLKAAIGELEQHVAQMPLASAKHIVETVGQQVISAEALKTFSASVEGGKRVSIPVNAALISSGVAEGVVEPQRLPGIDTAPRQRLFIRDLIAPGRTSSPAIFWVQQTGFTNKAAVVPENTQKPYSDIAFATKITPVTMALQDEYTQLLYHLLPEGPAWGGENPLIEGLAPSLNRVHQRADELMAEIDPARTTELIDRYEHLYGLPDSCAPEGVQTLQQRQQRLDAKANVAGGINERFYREQLDALGYTDATIEQFQNLDSTPDPEWGEFWRYYWRVNIPADANIRWQTCTSTCDSAIRTWGDTVAECVIDKLCPSHTVVVFAYPEGKENAQN